MRTKNSSSILDRVDEIERSLQRLKVDLLLRFVRMKKRTGIYQEKDLVKEVRKIRKEFWNEKYSKII
ncbi:MAG: hypothetical protein QME57_01290 [Patescibacteria group bacterium]|nr:hypothetical protein [Patescibacteria group bacterium]